ncbi:MAG: penicillin-binding transpeptidase domain-containing protein [Steroidobacteraceae bacterium]
MSRSGKRAAKPVARAYSFRLRAVLAFAVLVLAALALSARAVQLQVRDNDFLQREGAARYSRVASITAHRGTITDRFGEPLAVSTPVDSLWADPQKLALASDQLPRLSKTLHRDNTELTRRVTSNLGREFIYLARHLQPADAARVMRMQIPGIDVMREYRRYYPSGEVTGHLLGFTNIDDIGQEGIELAFDHWLAGEDGSKRVIRDNDGRIVQDVESIAPARPGRDLVLSIDLRLQYLAYRELKAAIRAEKARAGSAVVVDVATGEILAMVNQPTYNPNDRDQIKAKSYRNRATTDIFEPGSSIKPFVAAAALASGKYDERSVIDTTPFRVGIKMIEDKHDLGAINIASVLSHSSNVGISRIALTLEPEQLYRTLAGFGFGQLTSSGYPGESAGLLSHYSRWRPIGIATMSYGYGLSVTPLQLTRAYATLGSMGISRPVSFLRVDAPAAGEQVLDAATCRSLVHMLEAVVSPEGTGERAAIPGYRVAGKTGTAWKSNAGGYSTDRYMSVFGGLAPASAPRLAAVIVIDEPGAGKYYGGDVAAPVFARIVGGALRLMAVAPDAPIGQPAMQVANQSTTLAARAPDLQ